MKENCEHEETQLEKLGSALTALLEWYPLHARELPWRQDKEPYHVWLSEIMLQQTRVEAVKEYYRRFLVALPTMQDLAEVEEERLLKLWEGLGYYNRARNLKRAAEIIVRDYGGHFPQTYEEIHALPGIGDYTAGAIGSICFELQAPAVDGNVLRVYARVMGDYANVDKQVTKKRISGRLKKVYPVGRCGTATQSLMELGATVCLPNGAPRCAICPLKDICSAHACDTWNELPVRDEKRKRRTVEKTVFVLLATDGRDSGLKCELENVRVALRKRPSKGLLSGMWEFPNEDARMSEQEAVDFVASWNTVPKRLLMRTEYTHIFTHVEWRMSAVYIECTNPCGPDGNAECGGLVWVTPGALDADYALPSAFRPFREMIGTFGTK